MGEIVCKESAAPKASLWDFFWWHSGCHSLTQLIWETLVVNYLQSCFKTVKSLPLKKKLPAPLRCNFYFEDERSVSLQLRTQQVFADQSVSSMQAEVHCSNLLVTKAITSRFLVPHCEIFPMSFGQTTPSVLHESLSNWLGITYVGWQPVCMPVWLRS